jgi:predicted ATPase
VAVTPSRRPRIVVGLDGSAGAGAAPPLSLRRLAAGQAFVTEASRNIVSTRNRYRASQRPDNDPDLRAEVEGILRQYENWSVANERPERGSYRYQGQWVQR